MRQLILCAALTAVAASAGCGGGSSGNGKTTQSTSAWEVDDPAYAPGDITSLVTTPDGTTAYLTNVGAVLTFDVNARQLSSRSHLISRLAIIVAANDDASELYLMSSASYPPVSEMAVVALDPITGAQIPVPNAMIIGPAVYANGFLFVVAPLFGFVEVDAKTGGPNASISVPFRASGNHPVARTPRGGSILIGDASTLHVIDAVSRTLLHSIPIGITPNAILPVDEAHVVLLAADFFETVDITDPSAVPDVHRYPFEEELESNAPALLVDEGRRVLIARRKTFSGPREGSSDSFQPELIVIDVASGALRDRSLLLRQVPFDHPAPYRLAPTADPSAFLFTFENAIYVLERTAPF